MKLNEAYNILGLDPNSSHDEAKKQYRKLTKEFHPDVNADAGAEEKFKKINEAYKVVSSGQSTDREDIQWTQHQSSPFGPFARQTHITANPINLHISLSFKDSVLGCRQEIKFIRNGKCEPCSGQGATLLNNGCDKCGGRGEVSGRQGNMIFSRTCDKCHGKTKTEKCNTCHGSGTVKNDVSIQVQIPGGIVNGNILRLGGMGNYAGSFMTMDQFTDAHLHINIIAEEGLSLEGPNVISMMEISLLEALRGCNKFVKTILGEREVSIKPQSRNKEEIIIPHLGVNGTGNQKIILDVKYPKNIDKLIGVLVDEVV